MLTAYRNVLDPYPKLDTNVAVVALHGNGMCTVESCLICLHHLATPYREILHVVWLPAEDQSAHGARTAAPAAAVCHAATQTELTLSEFCWDDVVKFNMAPSVAVADAESYVHVVHMHDLASHDGAIPIYTTPELDPLPFDFDPIPGMSGAFHHGVSRSSAPYHHHIPPSGGVADPQVTFKKKTNGMTSDMPRHLGEICSRTWLALACDDSVGTALSLSYRSAPSTAYWRPTSVNGIQLPHYPAPECHAAQTGTHVAVVRRGAQQAIRGPSVELVVSVTREQEFVQALGLEFECWDDDGSGSGSSPGSSIFGNDSDIVSGLADLGFAEFSMDEYSYGG